MKCKEVKILLSACLDGELTPSEELALEQHVSSCVGCTRDKAEFARLRDVMPLWADADPSPWLAEKFASRLGQLEREALLVPQKRFRWGTFGAATAGFAAAILAIGLLLHSNVPSTREAVKPRAEQTAKAVPPPVSTSDTLVAKQNPVKTAPVINHSAKTHYVATAGTQKPGEPVIAAALPPTPGAPASASADYLRSAGAVTLVARSAVSENLGEASLAMNDTIERVRGNLQKSVDLMISKPPVPLDDSAHTDGGIQ